MISFSPERSGLHRTSQAAQMLTSLLSKIILGAIRTAQTTPHLSWKNSWVGQCHNLFFVSMIGLGLFWEHLSKIFIKCMKSNVRFCSTRKSLARPMLGPFECGLPSKWKCLLAGTPSKWRCWDLRYVCSSFLSCSFPCKIHLLPLLGPLSWFRFTDELFAYSKKLSSQFLIDILNLYKIHLEKN